MTAASGKSIGPAQAADEARLTRPFAVRSTGLSPSVTRTLPSHVRETRAPDWRQEALENLVRPTPCEQEVATAVASGASNTVGATTLSIYEATVKAHVSRLPAELDLANRVQVAILLHDTDRG